MKRMIAALAAGGLLAIAGSASAAANLITNGDFEAGYTPAFFTTSYTHVNPDSNLQGGPSDPNGVSDGEATFTIASDPSKQNGFWVPLTGTNKLMIINGSNDGTAIVFQAPVGPTPQNINVYSFTASVMDVCCNASFGPRPDQPSDVQFQYSTSMTGPFTTFLEYNFATQADVPGTLYNVAGSFTIPTTPNTVFIKVVNPANQASGNDFALDNLVLTAAVPEPATWAFMIMGVAGMGLMLRRRQGLAVGSLAA